MLADAGIKAQRCTILDFRLFWGGQVISSFGSSITRFALPLLVFTLTKSALDLAISAALTMVPYLCFGLVIGSWVDCVDRRKLMIVIDTLRGLITAILPLLYMLDGLTLGWIYTVILINAVLSIAFDTASFAALPNLRRHDDLASANGHMAASYSMVEIVGPLAAGALLAVVPLPLLLFGDALSFLISAISLVFIRAKFTSTAGVQPATSLRTSIGQGLRYVLDHPVVRWSTLIALLLNLIQPVIFAQFVLFAKEMLRASDAQLGVIYAAAGGSVFLASLATGVLNKRIPFNWLSFGMLLLRGVVIILLAFTQQFWLGLVWWALLSGLSTLWNNTARSLVQAQVPDAMLGRVISFSRALTWSLIPVSTLIGGFLIESTHNVAWIYAGLGLLMLLVAGIFVYTPLWRVSHYASPPHPADQAVRRRLSLYHFVSAAFYRILPR
jgi:MFS family permease